MEIKRPWELDQEGTKLINNKDYQWIIEYAVNKGIPATYFKQPDKDREQRASGLVEHLLSPRNFILVFNKNTSYMLELYYYTALVWACTTKKGFHILNVDELDTQNTKREERVDLLIAPYINPDSFELRRKRTTLSKIIKQRKAQRIPFITDCFVRKLPTNPKEIGQAIDPITEIYGEGSVPLFLDKNSNARIIMLGGNK